MCRGKMVTDLFQDFTSRYKMNLTIYSQYRIRQTFVDWHVPKDFADPMYNYLVYGYSPGSCFTAVLANDFIGAMRSSHPANTVEAFKSLAGWIHDKLPVESYGSYLAVKHWISLEDEDRRRVLEIHRLIYTSKEEVIMTLKSEKTVEPILY